MRLIRSLCVVLALNGSLLWAQQPAPPADSGPAVQKPAPPAAATHGQEQTNDDLPPCPARWEFHPETDGIYKIGGDVKPPKPTRTAEAEFSNEAREMMQKQHLRTFGATSLIGLVVGTDGKPRDLCGMKAAGWGLDRQAGLAVRQYRFKPATRNGEPVAVRLSVEVNFRRY